jgi:DNA-binding NarL/FixJ family response regulator
VKPIRILLVDDHDLYRRELRRFLELEPDFQIIGEAPAGRQALELVNTQVPDIILMDFNLPGGMNGLEVTRKIKASHPEIGIIIVTAYHNEDLRFQAMHAGGSAYYPKDVDTGELIEAIHKVAHRKS